jgi:hypothetical protein
VNRWYLDENDIDIYLKCADDVRWHYNKKELVRILNDLEAKLAEKEKENNHLHIAINKMSIDLSKSLKNSQDKISFALEQLNQAKGKIKHNVLFLDCDDYVNVMGELDNQIKQLKEYQK